MSTLTTMQAEQPQAAKLLAEALAKGRLHHAYVLLGPDIDGALSLAEALAQRLVCDAPRGPDACGQCAACRKLMGKNHGDVIRIAAEERPTIPIEVVRDAIGRLALKAAEAKTKVVIIKRAEQMTPAAQNALLKTLEEPSGDTCFLLTASRLRGLLPTIRSRCQTVRLVARDRLRAYAPLLAAGIDETTARLLGPITGGDIERAKTLGDADIVGTARELVRAIAEGDSAALLKLAATYGADRDGYDWFVAMLELLLRDALARAHGAADTLLYAPVALEGVPPKQLERGASELTFLRQHAVYNPNRTLALENILLTCAGRPMGTHA